MNIIICGAGKVGLSISKQLSAQGQSVTVIDSLQKILKKLMILKTQKVLLGGQLFHQY